MPELPEVEAASRILRRATVGKTIASFRMLHPSLRAALPARRLRAVVGRRIDAIERRGKHQLLRLDDGRVIHAHFRMAGDWHVGRSDDAPPKFARAALELSDGTRVSLVDPRALSTVKLHDAGALELPSLGPDPADAAFDAAFLKRVLASRRGPIKPALLDQRVASGVGNIYAVEGLWLARIDPRAKASSLGTTRLRRLVDGIRQALADGASNAGRYSEGEATGLDVYGREGEPCHRCGVAIRRIVQAGRSTYFCPGCQRR